MNMRLLLMMATLLAASCSRPTVRTWTLHELSDALTGKEHIDTAMQPYLEDALNQIMFALYSGEEKDVIALIPSPTGGKTWTMDQLKKAVLDPNTDPDNENFIRSALKTLEYINADGKGQDSIEVTVPALDISVWTLSDVEQAKHDPATKPELLTHLDNALVQMDETLKAAVRKEDVRITLVTRVGLVLAEGDKTPKIIPRM